MNVRRENAFYPLWDPDETFTLQFKKFRWPPMEKAFLFLAFPRLRFKHHVLFGDEVSLFGALRLLPIDGRLELSMNLLKYSATGYLCF